MVSAMDDLMEKVEALMESVSNVDVTEKQLVDYGLADDVTLRHYQIDGINWMVERCQAKVGCILGDEMGLGKTCQTISLLTQIYGSKTTKHPSLVLAPLSVVNTWKTELTRFAPDLEKLIYIGDKDTRERIRGDVYRKKITFTVLVTTYELCLKDESFLHQYPWHTLIVDEAHRLKNSKSLLYRTLLSFDFNNRVLLTGTPIQNNLNELYALLSFIAPNVFQDQYKEDFVYKYNICDDESEEISELHRILKPFLLRRTKATVVKDLPNRVEVVLYHGLTKLQKKYYKALLTKDIEIFESASNPSRTRLMNILMQLRKCVNHPYLFDGVEPEPFIIGDHLVEASDKLVVIDKMLPWLQANGHKVLMFSQMTHMLDILQDYLTYRGYNYERLDGSVRGEERYLAVQNFNEEEDTFVFLLSTRAGGQGLNLVSADTVIFVDSDYNPQNDLQAAARAHRIGQTRPVKIIRLIGRDTVEEIILNRAEAKLKLTDRVIEGGQFSTLDKATLLADSNIKLQDILKFGVGKLLSGDEAASGDIDLEAIIGKTVDKKWQQTVKDIEYQATLAESSQTLEMLDEVADPEDEKADMYVFEGTNYREEPSTLDCNVFNEILDAERASKEEDVLGERGSRKLKTATTLLPGLIVQPKTRKPLTDEEKASRKKKREETIQKRKQMEEEARINKRNQLWKKACYTSLSITYESDSEEELEHDSEEENEHTSIHYVVGDVTHPQTKDPAVILHCVDDSGGWGAGGVFSAISSLSKNVEFHYELAAEMEDLELGDSHVVPLYSVEDKSDCEHQVALIVAQHRNKNNQLSAIKMNHLTAGLKKIASYAQKHKVGVHLPRIGHNTAGFNWYGTERLLKKHLTTKHIPTYVYYFKRRHTATKINTPVKARPRRISSSDSESDAERSPARKQRRTISTCNDTTQTSGTYTLPSFMHGVISVFNGVSSEEEKILLRYLVAYDGDVCENLDKYTTHLVVDKLDADDKEAISESLQEYDNLNVISTQWLYKCFQKQRLLPCDPYRIELQS